MSKSKQVDARTTLGQKIRERFKNYCRFYSDGYGTFNSPWFLEAIAEQPTFLKKIKKWLELEYKIWFEPRTNSPKCPTPLSRIQWHLRYAVPNLISDKWSSFKRGRKPNKIYNEAITYLNLAYEERADRVDMLEEQFDELMKFYAEYGRATAGEYNYSGIKERYEKVFGERSVPGKYRDPNEEEDNQCHCSSCEGEGDYIATATDRDIADWRIEELKERGLYEEQQ